MPDIGEFLYNPDKLRQEYLARGYGEEFVMNQAQIFIDFIYGKNAIQIIAGDLDDICLGNCQHRNKIDSSQGELPCNDPRGIKVDTQHAGFLLLEVGGIYTFEQIEKNLRNFYLDQHSM